MAPNFSRWIITNLEICTNKLIHCILLFGFYGPQTQDPNNYISLEGREWISSQFLRLETLSLLRYLQNNISHWYNMHNFGLAQNQSCFSIFCYFWDSKSWSKLLKLLLSSSKALEPNFNRQIIINLEICARKDQLDIIILDPNRRSLCKVEHTTMRSNFKA